MNLVGESVAVVSATDSTTVGKSGHVVLETAKTLVLESESRAVRLAKHGTVFQVSGSGAIIAGDDIAGSLEERWRRNSR